MKNNILPEFSILLSYLILFLFVFFFLLGILLIDFFELLQLIMLQPIETIHGEFFLGLIRLFAILLCQLSEQFIIVLRILKLMLALHLFDFCLQIQPFLRPLLIQSLPFL